MAKTTLPTNYVDDVLNGAMDGKRRYREIPNADGTFSLEDATTYDQVGSNFGASQVNLMNDNINQSFDANKMLKTMDEVNAVTQEGYGVDALVVKELNNSLVANIYVGSDGKLHKVQGGADSVLPFSVGKEIAICYALKDIVLFNTIILEDGTCINTESTAITGNKIKIVGNVATAVKSGKFRYIPARASTNSSSYTPTEVYVNAGNTICTFPNSYTNKDTLIAGCVYSVD